MKAKELNQLFQTIVWTMSLLYFFVWGLTLLIGAACLLFLIFNEKIKDAGDIFYWWWNINTTNGVILPIAVFIFALAKICGPVPQRYRDFAENLFNVEDAD